jgi:parallel beta-helix repeat protein
MRLYRKLAISVLIALLASVLTSILPLTVSAQTDLGVHNLNTGHSYATIQEAIDDNSTMDGNVIQIDAGVYYEHVTLSKAVTLVGENSSNTAIDGQGNGTVIDIRTKNVTITGLTIRNSGSVSGSSGIHAYLSSFCNVSGNIIDGNWYGIWFESSDSTVVTRNNFTNNSNAIYVDSSRNGVISQNRFSANDFAVWLSRAEILDFRLNNISGNNYAVWIDQSSNMSMNDNWIVGNFDGVSIFNGSNTINLVENTVSANNSYAVLLKDCLNCSVIANQVSSREKEAMYIQNSQDSNFTGNVVSSNGFDGLYFYQSGNNVIDGNVVTNGKNGIVIYSSSGDVVSGNDLSGNDQGILLRASQGNEVRQNNVSMNTNGIQVSSSKSIKVVGNNVTGNANEGIYLVLSSNNTLLSNNLFDNGKAIVLKNSSDNLVNANLVSRCGDGLSLEESRENIVSNNTFSFGNNQGLVLSTSSDNTLSSNSVFNNTVGIRLGENSENNTISNNGIFNNVNGIDVEKSNENLWTQNDVSANDIGIQLLTSSNNTLMGNVLYGNTVALVLNLSDGNSVYNNMLTSNADGVKVLNSRNNTLELNIVSASLGTGVYTSFSSSNVFLHNSFFDNGQRPTSENSSNFWNDGIEGNFWGYEGLIDVDRNGIADSPFVLGVGDRDNFPLMAPYVQQIALIDDRQFIVGIVCNSSISDFRYFRSPESENFTTRISFRVSEFEGVGFCRIAILRALIQPPFDVTVDNSPPLYQSIVGSNGTHTWLYFSFSYIAGDVRIVNVPPGAPFWTEYWFWGLLVLALVVAVLTFSVFLFYRRLGSYRKTIEEVERKLREREFSPLEVARRQFGADVERRSLKIGKFEEKYGIKIRPRESLDDIFRGLKKKEEKGEEKDEVNS